MFELKLRKLVMYYRNNMLSESRQKKGNIKLYLVPKVDKVVFTGREQLIRTRLIQSST